MFNAIKDYFGKGDSRAAEIRKLESEADQFKLPSETLITIFKWLFFGGLAFLNYRLFAEVVPGAWGIATGIVAMMSEALAIYCSHYFSRAAGLFRWSLGICGVLLMGFSLVHGTFSVLDLIGVYEFSADIEFYSRVVAFPLLGALIGLTVLSLTMTHPNNIIRLKEALAHTRIAKDRAETASQVKQMRARGILEEAELEFQRERTERKARYLATLRDNIGLDMQTRQLIQNIPDSDLRASLAREHGFNLDAPQQSEEPRRVGFNQSKADQNFRSGGVLD